MKISGILLLALSLFSLGANAQGRAGQLSLIPRVGFSLTRLSNDYLQIVASDLEKVDQRLKPAVEGGFDVEYMATSFIGITAGAKYSLQGAKFKDFSKVYTDLPSLKEGHNRFVNFSRAATDLHYIQVPLMLHIYPCKGLSIDAGIQYGYLISAKESFNYVICDLDTKDNKVTGYYDYTTEGLKSLSDGDDKYRKYRETATDNYKRNDFSIPVGISYETDDVILSLRYNIGLTDISKEMEKMRNQVFSLSIGYRIPLLGN